MVIGLVKFLSSKNFSYIVHVLPLMYHACAGHSFQFGWAGHHQPPSQFRSFGCPAQSALFSPRWAKNQNSYMYMYMYCLHSILYQPEIFPWRKFSPFRLLGVIFILWIFFFPILLTFAVWVKYFCNAKEAELGEIFVQQKILAVQNIHTHCKCTCTCISCQDIIWEKGGIRFLLSLFPIVSGSEGLMVCQTLVAIAAHTTNIWDHVTPKLMTYLESKVEDHHEILVSCNT